MSLEQSQISKHLSSFSVVQVHSIQSAAKLRISVPLFLLRASQPGINPDKCCSLLILRYVVGLRATVTNGGNATASLSIFVALRPIGPAGGPVTQIDVSGNGTGALQLRFDCIENQQRTNRSAS